MYPPRPPFAPIDSCTAKIDFVLVLDGSGSMCDVLRDVREFVRDITTEVRAPCIPNAPCELNHRPNFSSHRARRSQFTISDWAAQFAVCGNGLRTSQRLLQLTYAAAQLCCCC